MSNKAKVVAGAAVAALVLLVWLPWWMILVLIGGPAAAYPVLDKSQRRRLRHSGRKAIDR